MQVLLSCQLFLGHKLPWAQGTARPRGGGGQGERAVLGRLHRLAKGARPPWHLQMNNANKVITNAIRRMLEESW